MAMRSAALLVCALASASAFAPTVMSPASFVSARGISFAPRSARLAPAVAMRPLSLQMAASKGDAAAPSKRQQVLAKLAVLTVAATLACSGGAMASALRGKQAVANAGAQIENVRQADDLVAHGGGGKKVRPLYSPRHTAAAYCPIWIVPAFRLHPPSTALSQTSGSFRATLHWPTRSARLTGHD